jgi:UPF0271 protein
MAARRGEGVMRVDLNCDLGEGFAHDEELMQFATSINVACGGHAGDEATMRRTVEAALRHGVAIGAHPGFEDRENFGRRELDLPGEAIEELVHRQVERLAQLASLTHVKPHGALYNMAARDERIASAIARGVKSVDEKLTFVGLAGSVMLTVAHREGLTIASEVFADRTYQPDGSLTPRSSGGAMIEDEAQAIAQVLSMVCRGVVTAMDGKEVAVRPDTVCLHGDGPYAVAFAKRLRECLNAAGVEVRALHAKA